MSKKYILALDQGTSSSRAVLFDKKRNIVAVNQQEFKQYYPKPGWVEQNPEDIWQSQINVAKELIKIHNIDPDDIAAIGITNQRETTIAWDKKSGIPVYNAIVWQDKRTSNLCIELKNKNLAKKIKEKTGLVIDSYFSATKISWILNNIDKAKELADKEQLAFGTVDSWLLWKLTNGKVHATDYSNASRTMLFNINELKWDDELLNIFDIPKHILPQVNDSGFNYAKTAKNIFNTEIPIAGIAGDQQAALFGQNCFEPGDVKNTYGTGCFMLMNTGKSIVSSKSGLLTTIAWSINGNVDYAIEGSVFIAGAAIKWLRDSLKLIKNASETFEIANSLDSNEGVYVVPAFSGLGAPYWDMYARGAILGITQGVTDKHIIRATLESLAYQSKDLLDAMISDSGLELKSLNVDGGASANDFLMQFQSDIIDSEVIRPQNIETTAYGAAKLAALTVDFWSDTEIKENRKIERVFKSQMDENKRHKLYSGWQKAVKRVINWENE